MFGHNEISVYSGLVSLLLRAAVNNESIVDGVDTYRTFRTCPFLFTNIGRLHIDAVENNGKSGSDEDVDRIEGEQGGERERGREKHTQTEGKILSSRVRAVTVRAG